MMGDSFVFFPTFYVEADEDISIESAYRMNNAINRFGIFGEEPDFTGWKQWEKLHVEAAIVQIIATKKNRKNGEKGGRPEKEIPEDALKEKCEELGNTKAVAEFFDVSERTIYRKKAAAQENNDDCKNCQNCQNPQTQTGKSNVNVNVNVNGNVDVDADADVNEQADKQVERGGVQSPPVELEHQTFSENTVIFPTEKAILEKSTSQETTGKQKTAPFNPPTVEEVAEYCAQRGNDINAEAFVAFYASKDWFVGKNKMKDWRQAVVTWEKRSREETPHQARGSPSGAAASCDRDWNSNRQVF